MLNKIIATTLVAGALLVSGCGSTNIEGEARLLAQSSLDRGDYSTAISTLEAKTDKTDSDNLILASAYMGEAGFGILDILTYIQAEPTNTGQDELSAFKDSIIANITDSNATITNLTKAITYYETVVGTDANVSTITDVSDTQLKLGLAYLVKVSLLLDDVTSDDAETASTINSAFNFISNLGSADIASSIDTMKLNAFGSSGDITATMIQTYQSTF